MNYHQAAASYRNANETVHKTRQVVLLYDAVVRFLQQSRTAIENQHYEERLHLLQKCSNILMGLNSALDYENGGEISQMLGNFYNAMDLRILGINRTNNLDDLDRIVREVKTMRDAWVEIDGQQNGTQPLPATPQNPAETVTGSDFSA